MPSPAMRVLAGIADGLMQPRQAARNARGAAASLAATNDHRHRVTRDAAAQARARRSRSKAKPAV